MNGFGKRLLRIVRQGRNFVHGFYPQESTGVDAAHLTIEFFRYGTEYYIAGRYGVFASLMPVAANLHHHAIEMLLKGIIAEKTTPEELKRKLRHNLRGIWKRVKRETNDPTLSRFDEVVKELGKFEDIRYPDELLTKGASMFFDVTRAGASTNFASGISEPKYTLCLEDVDELVHAIFKIAGRDVRQYVGIRRAEKEQYLQQDNR